MGVDLTPTIDEFRPVVLRVLADGQIHRVRDICELVANHMGLSAEVRAEMITSGQLRYVNRINWACSALTHAGLLDRPSRGNYRITADGRSVDARSLTSYSEQDMLEWRAWQAYQDEIAARKTSGGQPAVQAVTPATVGNPVELMEGAEALFNAQIETELRSKLQESSPEFFEKAVIDLLWAMGYGGDYGEKQHVGRSGDGGIDGIIRQDTLGLSNVYIQAKRYADTNKVGDPEIRNFMGSLMTKGALKGVFITTSDFQPAAVASAKSFSNVKIVLINGIQLTSLMLRYGVGVHKTRTFTLYEIDEDYFESDLA
ncbi:MULTISPECIES: restriction endonuclease [Schaalia]|uniref:restriction endonuclease n=1 Tax=Schaalia TaxID=2529408 RepID=UPI0026EEF06D|nr:restriction endonuclease [Schaalia hyovaginalis]MCI6557704.1 restriction endonuclease [Schaalia hyovaginalis]MDD7554665.1 restriction endonuclease [Schaalia hyovaginalis]MDY3093483.1 restriction endonuclease [Schaalia hyovaginalis]